MNFYKLLLNQTATFLALPWTLSNDEFFLQKLTPLLFNSFGNQALVSNRQFFHLKGSDRNNTSLQIRNKKVSTLDFSSVHISVDPFRVLQKHEWKTIFTLLYSRFYIAFNTFGKISQSSVKKNCTYLLLNPSRPNPGRKEKINLFLFSPLFAVPQKVFCRPLWPS